MVGLTRYVFRLVIVVLVLLVAGCDGGEESADGPVEGGEEEVDVDVEATEAALEALSEELASRDGVERVSAEIARSTGMPLPSQLLVFAEVEHTDTDAALALVEEIAEATWRSDVPSISTLVIDVASVDGSMLVGSGDVYGRISLSRVFLEERFGPRDG